MCYAAAITFVAVRVTIIIFLATWLQRAFDKDYLDWKVRDVSFSESMDWTGQLGNTGFGIAMTLGVVGLVLSNIFVPGKYLITSDL